MKLKTYDPGMVSVVVGGPIIKSWNKIAVARDEDKWNFTAGTQGEKTRTKNLNDLGTFILTLPQSSEDNATMSAFEISGAVISCSIIDKSGKSLHVMPEGTVTKASDAEYAKDPGDRVWTIKGGLTIHVVGGN